MDASKKIKILFLCRGNVGRSQIAEALLRKMVGDSFEIVSAGVKLSGPEQPIKELAPATNHVIHVMKEEGVDISNSARKQVTQEMFDSADKIIFVTDEKHLIPENLVGNPKVIQWDVVDPKDQSLDCTRETKEQIKDLLEDLIKQGLK